MAMIENILNSAEASDLDKLLQSFEFDNKQYVKLIEKENQQIEAYIKETEEKQQSISQLQALISKLDDDTKRSHRQFTQNRENCESLRKTTVVLMEHEVALHKKLTSIYSTGENDRNEREGVLQHYKHIWEDYSATYKRFPLAIKLQQKQDEFTALSQQVESARQQADQLKEKIKLAQGDDGVNLKILNNFITKLAEMKLDTQNVTKQIEDTLKEKENLEKELKEIEENKKKQTEEEVEVTGSTSRESIESQSMMIGMYCNRSDDEPDDMDFDIAKLNSNNNKEIGIETDHTGQSCENEDMQPLKEKEITVNRQEAVKEHQPIEVSSVKSNQSPKVRVNTQTNSTITTIVTPVPTIQIPNNRQNLIPTSSPSPNISKTPTIRPNPEDNQQQFHNMQITPRPRTPIITTPKIPNLMVPRPSRHESGLKPHIPTNTMPQIRAVSPQVQRSPMIRSQTPNIQPPVRQTVVQNKSPQVAEKKKTPTVAHSPKTPKNSSGNSTSSNSPFDLDKHLEKMQSLKKSPGYMPLKGRAMFDNQGDHTMSSPSAGFLQTFNQSNKSTEPQATNARSEFNVSLFSNISSPETPNASVFNFGADSMTTEPGSDTANSFMSFFEGSGTNADKGDTSGFSFNFGGNDSGVKSPESAEGFTFNFGGSSDQQSSSVFSLF